MIKTLKLVTLCLCVMYKGCQAIEYPVYPSCSDPSQGNSGSYFNERDGVTYWNHCDFPNPRISPVTCARNLAYNTIWDLCNIDFVLDWPDVYELDGVLARIGSETSFQCTSDSKRINSTVSLVLLNNIRVTYLANTTDICVNNCGEYYPELLNIDLATAEEIQFAVDIFAQRLADNWGNTLCDATVAVVYWHSQKMIGTGVPRKLQGKLKWNEVLDIRTRANELYFNNGSYVKEGLVYVLNEYNNQLKDIPPAYWLLCIMFLILILLFSILLFQFISNGFSSQFNESVIVDILALSFRIVTGVFMVEILLRAMLFMDRIIRSWHLVVFAGTIIIAFIFFIVMTR